MKTPWKTAGAKFEQSSFNQGNRIWASERFWFCSSIIRPSVCNLIAYKHSNIMTQWFENSQHCVKIHARLFRYVSVSLLMENMLKMKNTGRQESNRMLKSLRIGWVFSLKGGWMCFWLSLNDKNYNQIQDASVMM